MKKWILVLSLALILAFVMSCDLDTSRMVQFYASATSGLLLGNYYISSDGVLNSFSNQTSPWSVEIEGKKGDYVILTITGGDLTARIYVDGVLWKEKTGTTILQVGGYIE